MTCFYPIQAYRSKMLNDSGKRPVVFSRCDALDPKAHISLPCGRCIGCRLERSRQWAIRISHEASLYENNCFITLTYNDDNLPEGNTLVLRDFQLFIKRLRKRLVDDYYKTLTARFLSFFANRLGVKIARKLLRKFANKKIPKIRYFHCGEYGELYKRPHYHAIIFNYDFLDKVKYKLVNGLPLYTSKMLEELWPYGFSSIGSVTFDSAAYVARYIMKKHLGKDAWLQYADIDFETGEILFERLPEYVTMSRRPGIGKAWIDKYMDDTYKDDFIVLDRGSKGMFKTRPPRFYDSQYEIVSSEELKQIKIDRSKEMKKFSADNMPDRLAVKEAIKKSEIIKLPRLLEHNLNDNSF